MFDRMPPDAHARARAAAEEANIRRQLARRALGDGVTRVEQRRALAELERRAGKRGAKAAIEAELRNAGAPARGLGRWLGR